MIAAGYARVSTRKQEREGLSLDDQKARIAREAERQGWQLAGLVVDAETGKSMRRRSEFARLLDDLDRGDYGALIVCHIDRIARSLIDFLPVLERSQKHGWQLVVLDQQLDTSTPMGKAMAQIAGVFAELQGAIISERTREGLEHARARGTFRPGEHCRYDDRPVIARIMRWHNQDMSAAAIAERLTAEGVQPPNGGLWWPRTINRIIRREEAHVD